MKLQIEAVAQTQRLELVFAQFTRQAPLDLAAEFRAAVGKELAVDRVVAIHRPISA